MQDRPEGLRWFFLSVCLHTALYLVLVFNIINKQPLAVIENSERHDIIHAVVLGENEKSKILPAPLPKEEPPAPPKKELAPVKPKNVSKAKDAIVLKKTNKKTQAILKADREKKRRELLAKNLLTELQEIRDKQKKLQQKKMQQAFAKTLQEEAEKSLRQQNIDEEIHFKNKISRATRGEINKYKALIVQSISEHWLVPAGIDRNKYCQLMIRLGKSGNVLDVQIIKSSGDKALDRSARAAVLKASPLPVPKDKTAFREFESFVLRVKPENILEREGEITAL